MNHLLKHLEGVWPELGAWLRGLHVVKETYHGETFEGKKISCKFIHHYDILCRKRV